jgi:hypothetical protein
MAINQLVKLWVKIEKIQILLINIKTNRISKISKINKYKICKNSSTAFAKLRTA